MAAKKATKAAESDSTKDPQKPARKRPARKVARKKAATKAQAPKAPPTRGKSTDSKSVKEAKGAANRAAAILHKVAGMSHTEIAAELNVSRSRVSQYVREELERLAESTRQELESWRALELERLDALLRAAWPYALGEASSEMRDRGARTPEEAQAIVGVPALPYMDRCIRLVEVRARLLGLDKTAPVVTVDAGGEDGAVRIYIPANGRDPGT